MGETVAKPGGRWSELRGEDEGTRRLALRQRAEAVRLKEAALAKLADAVEQNGRMQAMEAPPVPVGGTLERLDPRQGELEDILRRAGNALHRQSADLDRLAAELPSGTSGGRAPSRSVPEVWGKVPPRNRYFSGRSRRHGQDPGGA